MFPTPPYVTDAEHAAYHAGRAAALREAAVELADMVLQAGVERLYVSTVTNYLNSIARSADYSASTYLRMVKAGAA